MTDPADKTIIIHQPSDLSGRRLVTIGPAALEEGGVSCTFDLQNRAVNLDLRVQHEGHPTRTEIHRLRLSELDLQRLSEWLAIAVGFVEANDRLGLRH